MKPIVTWAVILPLNLSTHFNHTMKNGIWSIHSYHQRIRKGDDALLWFYSSCCKNSTLHRDINRDSYTRFWYTNPLTGPLNYKYSRLTDSISGAAVQTPFIIQHRVYSETTCLAWMISGFSNCLEFDFELSICHGVGWNTSDGTSI